MTVSLPNLNMDTSRDDELAVVDNVCVSWPPVSHNMLYLDVLDAPTLEA
jgi:hypothetical protein